MKCAPVTAFLLACAGSLSAQAAVERPPNLQSVDGLASGSALFVFAHRFDDSANQLLSIPTLTLAVGLPLALTLGVDFTSFSEVVPDDVTENEAQFWVKRPFAVGGAAVAAIGGYNTAAESFDGALGVRVPLSGIRLFAEARAFSDLFGSDEAGAAGAVGAAVRLGEYLGLAGDVGKVLSESGIPAAWSSALLLEIPASPHTLSLVLTNTGATTLQGASREKVVGDAEVRYGFMFTVPLGGRGRWGRIFDQRVTTPW